MKKLNIILNAMILGLCANLFAVSVGDSVTYKRNNDRTSFIIRGASGSLKVIEPSNLYGPGYILRLDYYLNVLLKGEQKGDIGIFVPALMLASGFYKELEQKKQMSFGVFSIAHNGHADLPGRKCSIISADGINHKFNPKDKDKAKIIWFNWEGSITSVSDLKVTFKTHPKVGILGAVEIDISGVSNNGIGFDVGLDADI